MATLAYITPAEQPASYSWRAVLVPNDVVLYRADWEAIIRGALQELSLASNYEQVEGITPEQAAEVLQMTFASFVAQYPIVPTGSISPFAGGPLAPSGWLMCEGQEVRQSDYPELYTVVGDLYGSATSGWFRLPDFRGRSPVGTGQGQGLTLRQTADSGGEENHTLTGDESPSHTHHTLTHEHLPLMAQIGAGDPVPSPAIESQATSDGFGGNQAHNNMQPFLVVPFIIFTGKYP